MERGAAWSVLNALDEPLLMLGESGQVEHVNDAMRRWMARAGVEVEPLPRPLGDLALGLGASVKDMVASAMASGSSQAKVEMVQIGPRLVWLQTRVLPLPAGSAAGQTVLQLRDVTGPRRVELTLRAKDAALDATTVALGFVDRTGRLSYANPALRKLLGFDDRSEVVGQRFEDLWQVGDLARRVLDTALGGGRWEGELVARRTDGSRFAAHLAASSAGTAGSQASFVVFTLVDLTERARIEDELGESEATTRILLNANPDPVCLLSAAGEILSVNPAVLQILGRSAEELLGQPLAQALPGAAAELLDEHLRLARGKGMTVRYEDSMEGRNFDHRFVPVSDGLGGVARLALFSRDITEHKAAEAALAATNQMLTALIEASPLPIVALTPQQRVTLWSNAAERLYGWSEAEVSGQPHPAMPASEATAYRALLAATFRGEVSGGIEHTRVCKDGTSLDVMVYLAPLYDAAGNVLGAMEITEDITERKHMQGHLFEAQKMEALGRMAAGFGHDLNNLLQANLALAQVLREHHGDPDRVLQGADEIEQQAKKGAELLRQLLIVARRVPLKPEPTDLNSVMREAAGLARTMLAESIGITSELCPGTLVVEVDREQMLHALVNLAFNAADSMPQGGQLGFCTERGDQEAVAVVKDTGRGIDPQAFPHLFEPFFAARGQVPSKGLGLAVVREIVSQAGGTIEVDPEIQRGSAFRIRLPLESDEGLLAAGFEELEVLPEGRGRGERILVVEDEQTAREVFAEVLHDLGYEVVALSSAEEAGAVPLDPAFDLLLTDMVLPGASGLDLARGLKDRWPSLKVVLMSGYSDPEAMGALALIRARYLQKPFDMELLARELRAALDAH